MMYQNVVYNGQDHGDKQGRKMSEFYNEGKWKNFIEPHLPEDCTDMTFMEFGCNAGMFLKLAKDRGFKRVVGYDKDPNPCDMAKKYSGGEIHNLALDEKFDVRTVPAADILLMSNFHYHVQIPVLLNFINIMRRKVREVIIVSARVRVTRHRFQPDIETTRRLFRLWKEVKYIPPIEVKNDPRPRTNMYSVRFKSEIQRLPIEYVISKMGQQGTHHYERAQDMVRKGARFDFTMPIQIHERGRIVDGSHRMAYRQSQGDTTILTEVV